MPRTWSYGHRGAITSEWQLPEPKRGKNRIHLDLAAQTGDEQDDLVARALRFGARPADIGQGAAAEPVPWTVLADVEGNEFCVLEPRPEYEGTRPLAAIVVDTPNPDVTASFWTAASGLDRVDGDGPVAALAPASGTGPRLEFLPTIDVRRGKLRVHLDLRPYPDGSVAVEADRLRELGAVPVDVGQHDGPAPVPWKVLADPDGNEFCMLRPG